MIAEFIERYIPALARIERKMDSHASALETLGQLRAGRWGKDCASCGIQIDRNLDKCPFCHASLS